MSRFGLVGGSYTSQSVNADAQMTMNWYAESIESGAGISSAALYPTPGLKLFCDLVGNQVRGGITFNGRTFFVCDTKFCEVFSNGTITVWGTIAADLALASLAAGPNQILIASAGVPYVFTLNTNTLAAVSPAQLSNVAQVLFIDGFYFALLSGTNKIQSSNPLDATTWPGANATVVSVYPDNVVGIASLHRELWPMGLKASTVYFDSGNFPFPYDENSAAGVIEQGLIAKLSTAILDNTLFWIGQDSRGGRMAFRASGYTPQRISTHAIELAWSKYSTASDAIAFGYQDQGHTFYVVRFPTGNATWVYDVSTGLWHQRGRWNGISFDAHLAQCHVFAFDKHLVGDYSSGKIYDQSINYLNDNGAIIRRVRRAPHINLEHQWQFHSQLELMIESGLGPQPPLLDGNGFPRDPLITLRWSDDGGHTWSNNHDRGVGQSGKYKQRVIWRRLGRTRDRVYEFSASDPIPYRLIDAYLQAQPAYQPSKRIIDELRERA